MTGRDLTDSDSTPKVARTGGLRAVSCRDIWMRFGSSYALVGVNAQFERGRPVLIRGPNASGKSTLLSILAGLIRPSQGEVVFFGPSGIPLPQTMVKKSLAYFGQGKTVYSEMSALDNLLFHAEICGIKEPMVRSRSLLEELDIDWKDPKPCGRMSHGQQRRVGLARALLTEPELLLLDEPDSGLDRAARIRLAEIVTERARRAILIVASHDELLSSKMAARQLFLEDGRILPEESGRTRKDHQNEETGAKP